MICCWPFTVMSVGVLKEKFFFAVVSRLTFHSTLPLVLSSATTNGSLPPSALKMSALPTRMGEPPLPWTGEYFRSVCFQITLPARSRQAVP